MLVHHNRVQSQLSHTPTPGFLAGLFSCCSAGDTTPAITPYGILPHQQTNQNNKMIEYNLGQYGGQGNQGQEKVDQTPKDLTQSLPVNLMRGTSQIVVETPIVIMNKTHLGEFLQTPGVITQTIDLHSQSPSYLSEPYYSKYSENKTQTTVVGGENMLMSTFSIDMSPTNESHTYNLAVYDRKPNVNANANVNVNKAQLTQIAEIAYRCGYDRGMKNGKMLTEHNQKLKKMSQIKVMSDMRNRVRNSFQFPQSPGPLKKELNSNPIPTPIKNPMPPKSPSLLFTPVGKQQIKGASNINITPARAPQTPQMNHMNYQKGRTPNKALKRF